MDRRRGSRSRARVAADVLLAIAALEAVAFMAIGLRAMGRLYGSDALLVLFDTAWNLGPAVGGWHMRETGHQRRDVVIGLAMQVTILIPLPLGVFLYATAEPDAFKALIFVSCRSTCGSSSV